MGRLDDRVAIVTGAGRGIGRATALRFAEEGAAVVVNDVDGDPAEETVEEIKKNGGQAVAAVANTVELEQAQKMVETAVKEFGRLDILVNNAGITRDKTFHNMTPEIWDSASRSTSTRRSTRRRQRCRTCVRSRRRSSPRRARSPTTARSRSRPRRSAITGNPGQANYTAAKGAIISLTKTLARELGPFRINVNAVAPGFIETRLTAAKEEGSDLGIPEPLRNMAIGLIAIGRAGRPEDLANAHLFLCSAEADFVSGVLLPVTGAQLGV